MVFNHAIPALVLMLPEGGLADYSPEKKDWRIALFSRVTELIKETDTRDVLPVLAESDRAAEGKGPLKIWPLSEFLKYEDADLPMLYLLHADTISTVPYPVKMEHLEDFVPEIVLLWAQATKAEIDAEMVAEKIKELEELENKSDGDARWLEQLKIDHFKFDYLNTNLHQDLDEAEKVFMEHGSDFAKSHHERYYEAATRHVERLERAVIMDEL